MTVCLFFFSSRRRHTRSYGDWSSDVCSSDLSWDIDLATFGMEIVLNRRLIPDYAKKFEFVERELAEPEEEPGLKEFLKHLSVNGDATEEEIEFLKKLRFKGKHTTPRYYYR